jgi:hypothetical protein
MTDSRDQVDPADDAFRYEAFRYEAAQAPSPRARLGARRARCLAALLCMSLSLPAIHASAAAPDAVAPKAVSPEERSAARDSATAGIRAFQDGDYDRALDLLRKAEDIVHAPPHLIYIARAHAAKGEFVLARETLMTLVNEVLPADAPGAFRDAQAAGAALKAEIEPKIGRVSIRIQGADGEAVDGEGLDAAVVVTVDGKVVPAAILELPYPVDPGVRKIAVAGENAQGEEVSVTVAEGQIQDVTLHLVVTPEVEVTPAPAPAPVAPPPEAPVAEPKRGTSPWTFIGFGTAAAGVIVGSITGGISLAKTNDAKAEYCAGTSCSPAGGPAFDEANALANVSNVAFALAALGVGVGVYGLLATPRPQQKTAVARNGRRPSAAMPKGRLAISPQGVRAALSWTF